MKGGRSRSVRFHHLIERNIRGNYENAEAGKGKSYLEDWFEEIEGSDKNVGKEKNSIYLNALLLGLVGATKQLCRYCYSGSYILCIWACIFTFIFLIYSVMSWIYFFCWP